MTALQIISDLHLEMYNKKQDLPTITRHAPNLALLGDIGAPFQPHYQQFLKQCSKQFERVFVLIGNHELYGHTYDEVQDKVQSICNLLNNVILLNQKCHELTDDTIVIGCTLWSDIAPDIAFMLNDFKKIKTIKPHYRLTWQEYNRWHAEDVQFLTRAIEMHTDKHVIVLTHHAPSHQMQGKYRSSVMCSAFATPLEHMIRAPIIAWCSGHVHSNVDTVINGVRCLSNCKGYSNEQTGYKEDCVIKCI